MDKPQSKWLTVFIGAIVFLSYFALKSTFQYREMSLIIPLTALLMMPIGERLDRSMAVFRKVTTFCTVLFTLSLPLMAQGLGLIDTVVNLFVFVQVYSLIHAKAIKNYYHIILMSFFLLIVALVMSPSASMGLVLFGYVIATAGCLLLIDQRNHEQDARSLTALTTAVSRSTHSSRRSARTGVVVLLSVMFVILLGMTASIFVFMPRTEAGLLGTSVQTQVYTTGLDDEVQLDVTGTINNDSSAVMRVQFTDIADGRYEKEMYWRATTMGKYTGGGWERQGLITRGSQSEPRIVGFKNIRQVVRNRSSVARYSLEEGTRVRYEIFVDSYPEGGFPLLDKVLSIAPKESSRNIGLYWEEGGDYTVNISYRNEIRPYFVVVSEELAPSPEALRSSSIAYMDVMVPSDYRLLTEQNLNAQSLALIEEIAQGAQTNYDRVELIRSYLSGGEYLYTKDVPLLDTEHPIDHFINDVKSGHCELYASAMALMVRSQGIPARVVSGYRGGSWDASDKSYTITNNMAHLWVEVYFPDFGWITFDPAPALSDLDVSLLESFQNTLAKYSLFARIVWLQYVVGYSPGESFVVLRDQAFQVIGDLFSSDSDEDVVQGKKTMSVGMRGVLPGLLIFTLFGVLLLFFYRWISDRQSVSRHRLTVEQEHAKRLYALLVKKLEGMGIACRNRTAEELMGRVREVSDVLYDELEPFVRQYHDARFGSRGMTSEELARYKKVIRELELAKMG